MVDVRTHEEFQNGHAANSVNIPLHELAKKISEVKKLKSPLVLRIPEAAVPYAQ